MVEDLFNHNADQSDQYLLVDKLRTGEPPAASPFFGNFRPFEGGLSYRDFYPNSALSESGSLCRSTDCHIAPYGVSGSSRAGYAYRDVYPFLARSYVMEGVETPQDVYYQEILIDEKYKGFGACTSYQRPIDQLNVVERFEDPDNPIDRTPFDADGLNKQHILIVGEKRIADLPRYVKAGHGPVEFIDRDGDYFGTDF